MMTMLRCSHFWRCPDGFRMFSDNEDLQFSNGSVCFLIPSLDWPLILTVIRHGPKKHLLNFAFCTIFQFHCWPVKSMCGWYDQIESFGFYRMAFTDESQKYVSTVISVLCMLIIYIYIPTFRGYNHRIISISNLNCSPKYRVFQSTCPSWRSWAIAQAKSKSFTQLTSGDWHLRQLQR